MNYVMYRKVLMVYSCNLLELGHDFMYNVKCLRKV